MMVGAPFVPVLGDGIYEGDASVPGADRSPAQPATPPASRPRTALRAEGIVRVFAVCNK